MQRRERNLPTKAFLLAAGQGTRLRPITDSIPKCLVPIRGVPLLEIWLEICFRAGIKEILINLHAHADQVRRAVRTGQSPVKVQIVEEEVLLGSAGTVYANRDWIKGESDFWVLYADVLTTADLSSMAHFHQRHRPIATLGLYQVANPSQCGIAVLGDDFFIREFEEKPKNPRGNWGFSGIMLCSTEILERFPRHQPADIGFHVLPGLAGELMGYPIKDFLIDIGTIENYQRAQVSWPGIEESTRQTIDES